MLDRNLQKNVKLSVWLLKRVRDSPFHRKRCEDYDCEGSAKKEELGGTGSEGRSSATHAVLQWAGTTRHEYT